MSDLPNVLDSYLDLPDLEKLAPRRLSTHPPLVDLSCEEIGPCEVLRPRGPEVMNALPRWEVEILVAALRMEGDRPVLDMPAPVRVLSARMELP